MGLEDELNMFLVIYPDRFTPQTVQRVRKLIDDSKDKKLVRYGCFLETVHDYQLFFLINPQWHGKTPSQSQDRKGRLAFTSSLHKFTRRETECADDQKSLMRVVFPDYSPSPKLNDWDGFTSQKQWDEYFKNNLPLWTVDISKYKIQKRAAYLAYRRWVNKSTENELQRGALITRHFSGPYHRWNHLRTLDDIKQHISQTLELRGKTVTELRANDETNLFYHFVTDKISSMTKDKKERAKLRKDVFIYQFNSWKDLTDLVDWTRVYDSHPEWHGLTREQMRKVPGGGAFRAAYLTWENKQPEDKRKEYKYAFLPNWRKIKSRN